MSRRLRIHLPVLPLSIVQRAPHCANSGLGMAEVDRLAAHRCLFRREQEEAAIADLHATPVSVPAPANAGQHGFTLLGLLFLIAVLGIELAALGTAWHTAARRAQEAELLFVGDQFRLAIQRFYLSSPGQKRYPKSLEELLEDPRFPQTVRHLRRIYRDPVTGKAQWGLVTAADGGIMGVHSLSPAKPLKMDNFPLAHEDFKGKQSYPEWVFLYGEDLNSQTSPPVSPQHAIPGHDRSRHPELPLLRG